MSSIPNNAYIILIGAMKSGTSSLFNLLSQHPSICSSIEKEPEFFSSNQAHGVNVKQYEEIFEFNPETHLKCLEASTGYTKFPFEVNVPKKIKEYGIKPLFIYSVRNPYSRIESHYNSFLQHLGQTKFKGHYHNMLDLNLVLISMYHLQIREFLKIFPDKDHYFIVDFDKLCSEPRQLADEIFEWAGLKRYNVTNVKAKNITRLPTKMEDISNLIPENYKTFFPKSVRRLVKNTINNYDSLTKIKKCTLTQAEKNRLYEWLKNDVQMFGNEFGFPVNKWGF